MKNKTLSLIIVMLFVCLVLVVSTPTQAHAEPFLSYILLSTIASCVGGPTILIGILMASGALSTIGVCSLFGYTFMPPLPPSPDPYTITAYAGVCALVIGAGSLWGKKTLASLSPKKVIISLNQGRSSNKITKDQYDKSMTAIKDRLNKMLQLGEISVDEYREALNLIIE